MPHCARSDLVAVADTVRDGTFETLGGPHSYDAAVASGFRQAAVLALFTPTAELDSSGSLTSGPRQFSGTAEDDAARPERRSSPRVAGRGIDVFLVQRSPLLRHHPGQIALPGGAIEPDDEGPVAAALRETQEETGIPVGQVEALGMLPPVLVPISRFAVTPVLAWAQAADPEPALETTEVLHTLRVPVDQLLDPAARATVWLGGHSSSGFRLPTGWVWGFTGNLLDHLFTQLGWTRQWDSSVRHTMSWDEARGAQLLGHAPSPD